MLLLRAMSRSMAMQQQGSVSTIIREREDILGLGSQPGTMWMSRGCAELSLLPTDCGSLERWPHLSSAAVDPESHQGKTVKLALVAGRKVSWPGHSSAMRWHGHGGDAFHPSPLAICGSRRS